MTENPTLTRQPGPSCQNQDSKDSPYTLLPAFLENDQQLASNTATSSTVTLFMPSVSSASGNTSKPTFPVSANLSSSSHVICFSFFGEDFTYNLDTLEQDPQSVIELLKATESDRGNWMMVGAHYRRAGNPSAGISVMEALISFMTAQGMPDSDLKPAYLLLSGCETDMAKRVKSVRPSDAEGHYKRSQRLLQKVYGTFETPASQESHRASVSRPLERLPKEGSSVNERLERELRSLRKERNEQNALLAELRATKRKLEADLGYECRGRRRLLRDLEDVQKELAAAQKIENNALSQVKREVDARRKAEETACREKEMRLDLQRLCGQYTALGGLINALRSDGMQPPSL